MSTLIQSSDFGRLRLERSAPRAVLVLIAPVAALATMAPRSTLIAIGAACFVGLCLLRIDVAIMVLVATAPLEPQYPNVAGVSVTKLAGALCFAALALDALR